LKKREGRLRSALERGEKHEAAGHADAQEISSWGQLSRRGKKDSGQAPSNSREEQSLCTGKVLVYVERVEGGKNGDFSVKSASVIFILRESASLGDFLDSFPRRGKKRTSSPAEKVQHQQLILEGNSFRKRGDPFPSWKENSLFVQVYFSYQEPLGPRYSSLYGSQGSLLNNPLPP